jgi:predicted amidohydrolase YtcJ
LLMRTHESGLVSPILRMSNSAEVQSYVRISNHQKGKSIMSNLVLRNGAIYTVDKARRWAQALAVADGKIAYVGSDAGVEPYIEPSSEVIDLEGRMALPGFIDAHAHPSANVELTAGVNLHGLGSREAYEAAIAEFVRRHPDAEVLRGSGWDNTVFPIVGPDKAILDAIVPDRPVALFSSDGHSVWANSLALEQAGITADTPNPPGGIIERSPATGAPTGTLRESVGDMVMHALPDYTPEEYQDGLIAYQEMAARIGITTAYDAMLEPQTIRAYETLEADGRLRMRFRGGVLITPEGGPGQVAAAVEAQARHTHPYFQIHAGKLFIDGVVEGGTAFLLEPYANIPESCGEPIWSPGGLKAIVAELDAAGLQVHVHAIGDAAVRVTLDALAHARAVNGERDSRHALTHLQLVAPEDLARFAPLGAVAVLQPFWFVVGDYYWKLEVPCLGKERTDREYPMQSFIESGAVVACASDYPVTVPCDPLIGIQVGVNRSEVGATIDPDASIPSGGKGVLGSAERGSLADLIAGFTLHGAYANFMESEVGSLEVGKQADIVVLDKNLFEIPTTDIAGTRVLMTLVDGEVVYSAWN